MVMRISLGNLLRGSLTFAFITVGLTGAAAPAQAGPRDDFQMPFPCGQTQGCLTVRLVGSVGCRKLRKEPTPGLTGADWDRDGA